MFGSWRQNLHQAKLAAKTGRLEKAVQIVRRDQLHQYKAGQRFINMLVNQLLSRASQKTVDGKIDLAWPDLSAADEISLPRDRKRVSRRLNELIDLTIDQADSFLNTARPERALAMVRELQRRCIPDRRADEIAKIARAIVLANQSASKGDFKTAARQLVLAKSLRPELSYLDARITDFESQRQLKFQLTRQLKHDLLESRWGNAKQISCKLLKLAPDYRVAIDALKRCFVKSKNTKGEELNVSVVGPTSNEKPPANISDIPLTNNKINYQQDSENRIPRSFLLWVDGAGGFLVCCAPSVLVGQAVPHSQIDIPILGDLSRRHLKIQSAENCHIVHPLAPLTIDNKMMADPTVLKDNQVIGLGPRDLTGRVEMKFSKPHPLATSGRLDLVSRHRIQPWADGIILMSDMIVIGPNKNSHIQCDEFDEEIVIFRRDNQLMCSCQNTIEVNGQSKSGQHSIEMNTRISGENFSITLEDITV